MDLPWHCWTGCVVASSWGVGDTPFWLLLVTWTSLGPGPLWTCGLCPTLLLYVVPNPPACQLQSRLSFLELQKLMGLRRKGGSSWGGEHEGGDALEGVWVLRTELAGAARAGPGLATYAQSPWNKPCLLKEKNKTAHLSLCRVNASLRAGASHGPRRLLTLVCLVRPAASPCPVSWHSRPSGQVSETVNHPHSLKGRGFRTSRG